MLKLIFNLFEKKFIKYLNKKNSIKLTKDNLVFAFHDTEGLGYYKFQKELELPMIRMAKLQEYLMWLSKGVDKSEYLAALEFAETGLEGGIKDGKGLAKIGYILNQLKDRCQMVVHDELFYNIIACQLVREDESITDFNNTIQMEKVEAFKLLDSYSDTFFLNIQEFLSLLNLSNISRDQLKKLVHESEVFRKSVEKQMSSLSVK